MSMNNPLYTAQRVRKDDTAYGLVHGSMDGSTTTCGMEMDEKWWILTNAFNGIPTCKKCLTMPLTPTK
jgi:hypothetical protein